LILLAVRWYPRYPLAYLHVAEILSERGLSIDASCIWRWVQAYAPELDKRCRPHLKTTNKSYRVDETYIKVKGEERYLYRAVDATGQTIGFLRTAKRDAAGAKRFFSESLAISGESHTHGRERVNVDKNPAYPVAVKALKAERLLPRRVRLRPCKYLNNIVEQDHRTVKKRLRLAKGYRSFRSARANAAKNRNHAHDQQRAREMAAAGRRSRPSSVRGQLVRHRRLRRRPGIGS
jgi:transposase, IS6 family